jgi:conjugal transfer ATP-binding protein TraC
MIQLKQTRENNITKKTKEYLSEFLIYGESIANNIFDNESTYGFVLKLTPFSGFDEKCFNSLTQIVSYEIPDDGIVQVIQYASPNIDQIIQKWSDVGEKSDTLNINSVYNTLTKRRQNFFLNGAKNGVWGRASEVILRNFSLYFCISFEKGATERSKKALIDRIVDVRSKISKAFLNMNCEVSYLGKDGLNKFLNEVLFPYSSQKITGNMINPELKACEIEYVAFRDFVRVEQVIGDSSSDENASTETAKKFVLFEIDEWPLVWDITKSVDYVGDFDSGRGIPYPFYISFSYKSEGSMDSERQATKMRVIKTNQATGKLLSFVPAMREEIEDWQYITAEIDKGAKLAKACMHIVVMIDDAIEEKSATQTVLDHFYQLGFKLNQIRYDCINNLLTTLPMQTAENWNVLSKSRSLTTLITSACLNLLPIFADTQNENSPLMLFIGRRGQVFFFDNYVAADNGNYNMVVVGKSGSGKSVFLQEYMTSILRRNGQVVVIDDGRSFQNSCNLLGGKFVDFKGGELCINPFSLYEREINLSIEDYKADFEEPLIDLVVSILCIITNLDKNDTKNFNVGLYRTVLKSAVQIVLREKGQSGGIKDVYEVLKKGTSHTHQNIDCVIRTDETKVIADSLAYVLQEYAVGRYAEYYNGKATLSVNNLLTIFELSSLESNEILQTSVLLMVVFLVYIKMQKRERRTSLIIDEAWRLLRHDAIKGFIEGVARRARKYDGSLIVATQSISDFEEKKSSAAAAVLSQSDWRVLLSAERKDDKILKEQLAMKDGEIKIACHLKGDKGKYSEFMIRHSSDSWFIGRLVLDPFSAKLLSSKAEDVVFIKEQIKQGHSIEEAVERLINEDRSGSTR